MAMNIIAKDKKVIKWLGIPDCYKQQTNHENNKYNEVKNKQVEIEEVLEQKNEVDDASRQLLLKQIEQEEVSCIICVCDLFMAQTNHLYVLSYDKKSC
jgi:hypothetical protein